MATMPHCDSAVLHGPGECEYCDAYPSWQEARQAWGIAFTGQPPTDEQPLPCPSEVARPLDVINRWPGNQPNPTRDFAQEPRPTADANEKTRLEGIIRKIVKDVLRDERNRGN